MSRRWWRAGRIACMRTALLLSCLLATAYVGTACVGTANVPTPEAKLAEAQEALRKNPDDADALIWVGRRTAYLGRYQEAIEIFSQGIAKHPEDARFYRHRGHRYITVRNLGPAIRDFEKAAALIEGKPDEVEPDGLPNAKNIPTSTLQSNVWYHLGLSYYLQGDFEK